MNLLFRLFKKIICFYKRDVKKQIGYIGTNVNIPSDVIISGGEYIYL